MKELENMKELNEVEAEMVAGGTGPFCPDDDPNERAAAGTKSGRLTEAERKKVVCGRISPISLGEGTDPKPEEPRDGGATGGW